MKSPAHYAGLVLLFAPFAYLLYRSVKARHLKSLLKGVAWALALILWFGLAGYLLSQ
jgi:glycopeptide antibiotics resistance protein